jgi:ankyrin repeat protein
MAPVQVQNIHIAVLYNKMPPVQKLLRRKRRSVNETDSRGATPLMLAAMMGNPWMVTFLLRKGASWWTKDKAGYAASDYVKGAFADDVRKAYRKWICTTPSKAVKQRNEIQQHLTDIKASKTKY